MKGSGAVKYLNPGNAYLIQSVLDDEIYFYVNTVSGKPSELYAAIACEGNQNEVVVLDSEGNRIQDAETYLFESIDWNEQTKKIKAYNGQTVYFEPNPWNGTGEYTVIP